ncbi:uncharacterized protein KGF55_000141 [Candida pseudojiufengensis]|uniref:uncharacterized protein n=1 Tax=Candida pseudojiufengensis TaxID=497109 RepID=UPI002225A109|nr:uncharacterized protein KGF55_000141 [Candida pseudojiufengensis]KAI5966732.1 hypothetical protein KGF55_000141 [Candida pseudojiufengensis]
MRFTTLSSIALFATSISAQTTVLVGFTTTIIDNTPVGGAGGTQAPPQPGTENQLTIGTAATGEADTTITNTLETTVTQQPTEESPQTAVPTEQTETVDTVVPTQNETETGVATTTAHNETHTEVGANTTTATGTPTGAGINATGTATGTTTTAVAEAASLVAGASLAYFVAILFL